MKEELDKKQVSKDLVFMVDELKKIVTSAKTMYGRVEEIHKSMGDEE